MKSSSLLPLVVLFALGPLTLCAAQIPEKDALKPGACPVRPQVQCFRYEKPECENDWQCPELKRCCPDRCGIKCLEPVPISVAIRKPVRKKPGKCPVFNYQCLLLNPPNLCERDRECDRDYKCCKGPCGKICMSPVKA